MPDEKNDLEEATKDLTNDQLDELAKMWEKRKDISPLQLVKFYRESISNPTVSAMSDLSTKPSPEYEPISKFETDPSGMGGTIPNVLSDLWSNVRGAMPGAISSGVQGATDLAKRLLTGQVRPDEIIEPMVTDINPEWPLKALHDRPVSTALNILGGRDLMRGQGMLENIGKVGAELGRPTGEMGAAYRAAKVGGAGEQAVIDARGGAIPFRKPTFDATNKMEELGQAVGDVSQGLNDEHALALVDLVKHGGGDEYTHKVIRSALEKGVDPNSIWNKIFELSAGSKAGEAISIRKDVDVSNVLEKTGMAAREGREVLNEAHRNRLRKILETELLVAEPADKKLNTIKMAMTPDQVSVGAVLKDLGAGVEAQHTAYQTTHQQILGQLKQMEQMVESGVDPSGIGRQFPSQFIPLVETADEIPQWVNLRSKWEDILSNSGIEVATGKGSVKDVDPDALARLVQKASKGRPGGGGLPAVQAQEIAPQHRGSRSLVFGRKSYIQMSPAQQKAIEDVDSLIHSLPTDGRASIIDLDALKKSVNNKLHDLITSPFNQYGIPAEKKAHVENILEQLYGVVRQEAGKGIVGQKYNELMKADETAITMRNELAKLLALRSENPETIYQRMKDILPKIGMPEYDERKALLQGLEKSTGQPIMQKLEALELQNKYKKTFRTAESLAESIHDKETYNKQLGQELDEIMQTVLSPESYAALKQEHGSSERIWVTLERLADSGFKGPRDSAIGKLYNLVVEPTENGAISAVQQQMKGLFPELEDQLLALQEAARLEKEAGSIRKGLSVPGASESGQYTSGQITGMANKALADDPELLNLIREQNDILKRQEQYANIIGKTGKFTPEDVKIVEEMASEVLNPDQMREILRGREFDTKLLDKFRSVSKEGWTMEQPSQIRNLANVLQNPTKNPRYNEIRSAIEAKVPFLNETVSGRLLNPWFGKEYLFHRITASAVLGGGAGLLGGTSGGAAMAIPILSLMSPRMRGLIAGGAGKAMRGASKLEGVTSASELAAGRLLGQYGMERDKVLSTTPVPDKEVRSRLVPSR